MLVILEPQFEMNFECQRISLPIVNYDHLTSKSNFRRHSALFGGECKRGLIVGSSGCGKTNVMLTLLIQNSGLRYLQIYICSKSLYQEKYAYLRHLLQPITEIGYYEFDDVNKITPPSEVKEFSTIIFDDIACDIQSPIKQYFSFGRHKKVDCFYLSQTYSTIPKQLVRDNSNLLILFHQDPTNLKHVFDDHVLGDMTFEVFQNLCNCCWQDKYGILVIDKDCSLNRGRYRKGFDQYVRQ